MPTIAYNDDSTLRLETALEAFGPTCALPPGPHTGLREVVDNRLVVVKDSSCIPLNIEFHEVVNFTHPARKLVP